MLARYREVVEIVLHFRESKEKLIRRAVISLIPRLAAFAPERFAATYLSTCTDYLINIVKCVHTLIHVHQMRVPFKQPFCACQQCSWMRFC